MASEAGHEGHITLVPGQVQVINGHSYLVTADASRRTWAGYAGRTSVVLGSVIITAALLNVFLNIAGLVLLATDPREYSFDFMHIGHGFWGSILFLVSGGLAVGAGRSKTTCCMVGNLVLSVLAVLVAGVGQVTCSAAALGTLSSCARCVQWEQQGNSTGPTASSLLPEPYSGDRFLYENYSWKHVETRRVLHVLMLLLSLLQVVAALWSAAICCSAVCCGRNKRAQRSYHLVPTMMCPDQGQYAAQSGARAAPAARPQHAAAAYGFEKLASSYSAGYPPSVPPPAYGEVDQSAILKTSLH